MSAERVSFCQVTVWGSVNRPSRALPDRLEVLTLYIEETAACNRMYCAYSDEKVPKTMIIKHSTEGNLSTAKAYHREQVFPITI